MLVLHLMVKIKFFLEGYKDLAHPLTETLGTISMVYARAWT